MSRDRRLILRSLRAALLVGAIPVIAVVDFVTGTTFGFSILYLSPIAVAAWWHGRGIAALAAVLAAVCWTGAEFAGFAAEGRHYPWYALFWNGMTRALIYIGAAYLVATLRTSLDEARRARDTAETAVDLRDRFIATAAHELRQPVTALTARAQLVGKQIERGSDPEALRAEVGPLLTSARGLDHLMRRLLDSAELAHRGIGLQIQELDLAALVRDVAEMYRLTAGPGRRIELEAPDRLMVTGDRLRLEQVVSNLVGNALKYSPDGDVVEVRLDSIGDVASLLVRDHGIGIPLEARERIFEPYRQEHPDRFPGMGLGLAVVAEIVKQHGGRIRVDSPETGGSVFSVELPKIARVPPR